MVSVQSPDRTEPSAPAPDAPAGAPADRDGVDLPWWATALLVLVAITAGAVASALTDSHVPFAAAAVMVAALVKWQGPFPVITIGRDGPAGPRP